MSLGSEFKEFAMKGNVVDLAVGVIVGAAFGKIVSSLVGNVFMPLLGKAVGGFNFSDLAFSLGTDPTGKPVARQVRCIPTEHVRLSDHCVRAVYGDQGHQSAEAAAAGRAAAADATREEQLLTEIRDLLAKR